MIKEQDLFIIQPKTPQEVDELSDMIHSVAQYFPQYDPEFLDDGTGQGMREFPEQLYLIMHKDFPIGLIEIRDNQSMIELGRDTLSFGGVCHPDYRRHALTPMIAKPIIRYAFLTTGKRKMLAEVQDGNDGAKLVAVSLGFKRIGKTAQKDPLYLLKRKNALEAK